MSFFVQIWLVLKCFCLGKDEWQLFVDNWNLFSVNWFSISDRDLPLTPKRALLHQFSWLTNYWLPITDIRSPSTAAFVGLVTNNSLSNFSSSLVTTPTRAFLNCFLLSAFWLPITDHDFGICHLSLDFFSQGGGVAVFEQYLSSKTKRWTI